MPPLSIVIPAYNEENRLPGTVNRILAYMAGAGCPAWEVIVVNDGSRDATADIVRKFSAADPRVRLLQNPGNRGKGYSVKHGMLESRLEWALLSDADLSAPIEEVEKLFAAVRKSGARIAIGSRALDRSLIGVHQSPLREFGGRVFNALMQMGTGLRLWDTQCGFKLFHRDALHAVFSRQRLERFGFDVEALYIAQKHGLAIEEVPVRWNHVDGTKVSMLKDSIDMFGDIARVRWYDLRGYYR